MSWTLLVIAGFFEVAATTTYRFTDHLHKLWPTALFFLLGLFSFICLQRAIVYGISIGTAYAVWTGIGAAGTVAVGLLYFDEPATAIRLMLLAVLIASIIGLKLAAPS